MRLRKVIWVLLFLSLIMVIINFASGLMYDCKYADSCASGAANNYQYSIMKLFSQANSHGAVYDYGTYPKFICCNFTGVRTDCSKGSILSLSASTNAHAEIPTYLPRNYWTDICYTNLACIATAGNCPSTTHPIKIVSLSSSTNAHLEEYGLNNFLSPPKVNICCNNSNEPQPLQNCSEMGFNLCINPAFCGDGTVSSNDPFGECCLTTCCNLLTTQQQQTYCDQWGWQCGGQYVTQGNCNLPVDCGNCGGNPQNCDAAHICTVPCVPNCVGKQCGPNGCPGGSCGICSSGECNSTGSCVPIQETCDITSAYWSNTTAKQGDCVYLITKSNLVCAGQNISFEIKEYDNFPGTDDPVIPDPVDVVINASGDAIGTWFAKWQNESWPESPPPEYYFKAKIKVLSLSKNSFNMLEVTYTGNNGACDAQTCFDYKDEASCNTNKCQTFSNDIVDRTAKMIQLGQSCGIQECASHGMWASNCACSWNATNSSCGFTSDWNSCSDDESCGDGIRDICEACDGNNLSKRGGGTWNCTDFGFLGGTLKCDVGSCDKFDFSNCTKFSPNNDGKVDFRNETCDTTNLTRFNVSTGLPIGIWSCATAGSLGIDEYDGGVLSCANGVLDFGLCTCTLSPNFKIGTCSVMTGNIKECNTPPEGFLTIPWNGLWAWGTGNGWTTKLGCEGEKGVGCIEDSGAWHYDPENKTGSCKTGGVSTIECPEDIRLPFFGAIGIILVGLIIVMIYLLSNKRRKKVL